MDQETRNCQNCKKYFTIESDDFSYYEKINVGAPSLCPQCRAQLRLSFRNERVFYKRNCDKCKKDIITMYSPNKTYPVWCHECWWADDWDSRDYGAPYDLNKPFFEQFKELFNRVPKPALLSTREVNSQYVNYVDDSKDCYLIMESSNNENCIHCYWIQLSKDLVDCSFTQKVERSYQSDDCYDSYNLQYCKGAHSCSDSFFLLNCRGCSNCLGCINLRQQKYQIFNKQYTKEEYQEKLKSYKLDTYSGVESFRKEFEEFIKNQPRKYAEIYQANNSTGNYMTNVKDNKECFHSYDAENNKYCVHVWRGAKDCMDCVTAGRNASLIYNSLNSGVDASSIICSFACWNSQFIDYSANAISSNHCFGCVGRNQNYCILNKQYSKEEYEALRKKIIEQMKKENIYGEFFPKNMSAFGYNETSAILEFPLTKEDVLKQGFKWEDTPRGTYGKETMKVDQVPDGIKDVNFDAIKEVFVCKDCNKNYKVIAAEFAFYQKNNIPLPRLCPDCRHAQRLNARGPNKLWHRSCMCEKGNHSHQGKCPAEFQTSYAPERKEIIYCEQCYNAEVV